MRTHILTVLLLLATTHATAAGVYRWVDEHGKVHYSDRPPLADTEQLRIRRGEARDPAELRRELDRLTTDAAVLDARDRAAVERRNAAWARESAQYQAEQAEAERLRAARLRGEVVPGMRADDVHSLIGKPDRINRDNYGDGWDEQWVYDRKQPGQRYHRDYVYVRDGVVTSVQLRR